MPPEHNELMTPEGLMAMATAFQRSRALLTAVELGVFTALAQGEESTGEPMPSAEVAARIQADPRATDRLLNALTAMGLLRKEGGRFANTALTDVYLVKGRTEYMSNLGHTSHLYASWATLTEAVRKGGSVEESSAPSLDESRIAQFIEAMHRRALKSADSLVARLDLSGVNRLLDVGGGSGVYAMAFARARKGLQATVLDLPPVARLAKGYIQEAGMSDRVSVRHGDYRMGDLGLGYDLVFLSAIVHINSPDANRALVRKAAAALNPGGRIVIQDFVMEPERVFPQRGALFALNMLVNTPAGDTYTGQEIASWLKEAGCRAVEQMDSGPDTAMVIGTWPQG